MRAFKIIIFLIFLSTVALGQQLNKLGHPFVRNFLPEEYDAESQNWSIAQDNRGVMYFGNNDNGILEYDGVSWRKYSIPNKSIIRSLAVDNEGTVYVGAIGDFGYLKPDHEGNLSFVSLNIFNKDSIKFSDVYKTYFHNNKVYFCSSRFVFIYDFVSTTFIDLGEQAENANFMSFIVNGHFYVGSFLKGLRELVGSELTNAPNNAFFIRKTIFIIIPDGNEHAIIGTDSDFYRYNQVTGETKLFTDKSKLIGKVLEESFAYHALAYPNGNFGFAFPYSGVSNYLEIKNNIALEVLNANIGLKDPLVTHLFRSNKNFEDNPLWLTTNYGISRAEIHSPFRKYTEESGFAGQILDIKKFNGSLYIGTLNGLYKEVVNGHFTKFIPISQVSKSTWSLEVFNNPITKKQTLLIGSASGVYEIDEKDNLSSISEAFKDSITIACFKLYQSKVNPNRVYIGDQGGLTSMDYKQGRWVMKVRRYNDKELRSNIRSIGEDNRGNIWLGTYVDGVAKYSSVDNTVEFFGIESGLNELKDIEVTTINDSLFFNTKNGLFRFDYKKNQFFKTNLPGTPITIDHGIYRLVKYNDGYLIAASSPNGYWIELISKDSSGNYAINTQPFKRLPSKQTDAIYLDNDGIVWFGTAMELFSYNPNTTRNYSAPFNALIRKVISKGDSVLFNGTFQQKTSDGRYITSLTQKPEQIPNLSYKFNELEFNFSATFYEEEDKTEYSYLLSGYDENWSRWNFEPKKNYTNLSQGNYTFKVKARNIYGAESYIAEYKFTIAPPWYFTVLAYIVYGILFIVFVWLLVRWNTRRLIAEKERLEQIVKERTAEVVRQKGEIELQRDKIAHQNEEIKSSIQYASRIQGAILTPQDQLVKVFPNHFILFLPRDIVSGDFYQILQVGNKKISVVADCTGHGVPGGFMSMLGMSFLSQIINRAGDLHPGDILNQLRASIIHSLHQTGEVGGSKDGMDIAIFTIDETTKTIEFAGANNPLILIRDNEVQHIKGDKMPIGIHMRADEPFTNNVIELKPGDRLYTFSDGYADQFGGPDQRKFMIKNLKELLLQIHQKPMAEQREILHQTLLNWHGSSPRIDDVVVMGVQL